MFSEDKKKALEVFVTSATSKIYALRHSVPPEVFGSFGSFFSRNPKDLRVHLLDAIEGNIKGFEVDKVSPIPQLARREFEDPAEALTSGVAKSRDFFKKWYGKYSHKSIANTVWVPFVANDVSQLFARELAYDQLAFFIEQSTRYVKWSSENMFFDPTVMGSKHAETYKNALAVMVQSYEDLTEEAMAHYQQQLPFKEWQELQNDQTLESDEKVQQAKYKRELRGRALDFSRFILPQACQTNIAWILDARSTEFDIGAWKGHPLDEMKAAAHQLETCAGEIAPSLLKYTGKNAYYEDCLHNYNGDLNVEPGKAFNKGISIISSEKDSLNKVIAFILKRHGRGGTWQQRYEQASRLRFDEKVDMLKRITQERSRWDEWVQLEEEIDSVKVGIEIRSDIGAIRDWRRHQKWDRGEGLYTLDNGVHRPYMINDMPDEVGRIFDHAIETAHNAEKRIREDFPHQAQYVIPMAAMHSLTMTAGLDQLQYLLWTRTTPEGNFSYREDAFNIAEEAVKEHPWMLGYEVYPKEKEFLQVYKEAPLKGFLRLQTDEERLHQ